MMALQPDWLLASGLGLWLAAGDGAGGEVTGARPMGGRAGGGWDWGRELWWSNSGENKIQLISDHSTVNSDSSNVPSVKVHSGGPWRGTLSLIFTFNWPENLQSSYNNKIPSRAVGGTGEFLNSDCTHWFVRNTLMLSYLKIVLQ